MNKMRILLCLPLILVACGKSKDPVRNIRTATQDKALQKTWQSECSLRPLEAGLVGVAAGLRGVARGARIQYKFLGANLTRTVIYYTNADCSGDALTLEESGTFRIEGNKRTSDGGRFINMNFKTLKVRAHNEDVVKLANQISLCGLSNWDTSKNREIKSTRAAEKLNCINTTVPRSDANIYLIQDETLLLGSPSTGPREPSSRPTSLDTSERYMAKK